MLRFASLAAVVAAATFFSLTPALAQVMTAEQRAACKADYDKYCKGTVPGGGRIIACLNNQYGKLAEACKKVVDAQRQ